MQTSNSYYQRVMCYIEKICCECTGIILGTNVRVEELYAKKKPTFGISVARGMAFMIMHDFYGVKYKIISKHSRMRENSIIHKVAYTRLYAYKDNLYKKIFESIKSRI